MVVLIQHNYANIAGRLLNFLVYLYTVSANENESHYSLLDMLPSYGSNTLNTNHLSPRLDHLPAMYILARGLCWVPPLSVNNFRERNNIGAVIFPKAYGGFLSAVFHVLCSAGRFAS